jgi:TrmH family RNA methyltransferase
VPVAYDATLVDVVDAVRRHDRPLAVASGGGDEDLFEVVAARMACRGSCWLIGSEAHGASPEALEEADIVVRIPMWGGAESLNAAAAAAILLYVPRYEGTVHGRTAPGSMTADAAAMPTG